MTKPDEAQAGELVEAVERDIRIAIWNTGCWQGKPQEVAQSFIRHAMDEPCMKNALATVSTLEAEIARLQAAMREAVEAADDILAPLCAEVGRCLYDAPNEDAISTMRAYEVVIPFSAFKRLYDATDKETIDALLSDAPDNRGEGEQS